MIVRCAPCALAVEGAAACAYAQKCWLCGTLCSVSPEAVPIGAISAMGPGFYLLVTTACWARLAPLTGGVLVNTVWPQNYKPKDGETFEYIVVGAGAAGSAVASRLALAGKDVLLVEAGGDPTLLSTIPGGAPALLGSSIDYKYDTITNNISCLAFRDQQCAFSRGKCLGGSTSINYMMYTRGNPHDFDEIGISGWAWSDMKPYFLRYEGLRDLSKLPASSVPYHNTTGIMDLEFFSDSENPWHAKIIEGYEQLNFPNNPDVNAASQIGVSQVVGYVYENRRMSTARGFLSNEEVKKKLKVAKNTKCTKVILDDDNIARGITVVRGLFKKKLSLYASKEVILSAGAVVTPQLLMLSGIGPAEHLQQHNITVRADVSVGDNMTDHLLPLMFVKVNKGHLLDDLLEVTKQVSSAADLVLLQSGPLTSNGLTDVTIFVNTSCYDFENRQLRNDSAGCELPTTQYINAFVDRNLVWLSGPLFQKGTDLNDDVSSQLAAISTDYAFIIVSPQVLRPHSQGRVRLRSADPLAEPAIFPNYLSDERDVDEMVRAIKIVEHVLDTAPFREQEAALVHLEFPGCPEYSSDAEGYWRCYCRHMTHTSFHAVGTAALGRVTDAGMCVSGTRRLRACDLSVMPHLPRGNTAATAIALGEKLADLLLQDS